MPTILFKQNVTKKKENKESMESYREQPYFLQIE